MASPVVNLVFTDGNTAEAVLNPRIMVEVERKYGTIPAIEGTLYGAWLRLGRPGVFDDWLDTIDALDSSVEEARPTQPEASDGSSPN
jgi:hypothetical protein